MELNYFIKAYSNSQFKIKHFENEIFIVKKSFSNPKNIHNATKIKNFPDIKFNSKNIYNFKSVGFKRLLNKRKILQAEMPFIAGLSGMDILKFMTISEIEKLKKSFVAYIKFNLSNSKNKLISKHIYLNIINDQLNKDFFFSKREKKKLDFIFNNIPDELSYPVGLNHGDFTLDNMIFNNNQIWLIDQIKSPIETPIQDLVKLFQDTKKLWFLRNSFGKDNIRLKLICDFINNDDFFKLILHKYKYEFYLTELCSLFRIIPYLKDDLTYYWLKNEINKMIWSFK